MIDHKESWPKLVTFIALGRITSLSSPQVEESGRHNLWQRDTRSRGP